MKKKDLYYERIPTKLLREDVRYLGNILGHVIKAQEGQKFFSLVEKVRKLSKANKVNPNSKKTLARHGRRYERQALIAMPHRSPLPSLPRPSSSPARL